MDLFKKNRSLKLLNNKVIKRVLIIKEDLVKHRKVIH